MKLVKFDENVKIVSGGNHRSGRGFSGGIEWGLAFGHSQLSQTGEGIFSLVGKEPSSHQ
jgi:hypothetical protein